MTKSLCAWLLIAGLAVAQILVGGTRLLFSIPACILIALACLVSLFPGRKILPLPRVSCIATTIAFCAFLLVRDYLSPVEYLARPDFFIITGALAVYLLVAVALPQEKFRSWIFYALLLLAVVHAGIGAIQFKNNDQFMLLPGIYRPDHTWRASGFYISGNHYAGMLEVIILMAISFVCWGRFRPAIRLLIGYAGAVCLLGLALSGSRGGYISFAAGLLAFMSMSLAVLRKTRPRKFQAGLVGAISAILLLGLVVFTLLSTTNGIRDRLQTIDDSKNPRLLLWKAALVQWHLAPLWGTGAGTYLYYGRLFRDPVIQADPIYVHNDYLHLLAEYGEAGAALFLLFFAAHAVAGGRNVVALVRTRMEGSQRRGSELPLQLGALSAIAAYTVHSALDFNLHIPANAYLMAWIFGMVANRGAADAHAATEPAPAAGPVAFAWAARAIMGAAGLALLVLGLPKLPGEWFAEKARQALRGYHLAEAHQFAGQALRFESRNPDIYYYAGEAMREMAEKKLGPPAMAREAAEMFQSAIALFPDDERSVMKLAQTYDQLGEFDLAAEQLDRAVDLDPKGSYPAAFYGLHYQMQGMPIEAATQYRAALDLDPGNLMAQAGVNAMNAIMQRSKTLLTPPSPPAPTAPEP